MKKIFKYLLIGTLLFSLMNPSYLYATNIEDEGTIEVNSDSKDEKENIFDQLKDNIANAEIDENRVAEINKELFGNENYNPLQNAKNSINKFIQAFSRKDYNKDDFNGEADTVYEGISNGAQEVVDSGILDSIYGIGTSILNLIVNIVSSIGEALQS